MRACVRACACMRVRTVREVLETLVLDLKLKGVEEELGVILYKRMKPGEGCGGFCQQKKRI